VASGRLVSGETRLRNPASGRRNGRETPRPESPRLWKIERAHTRGRNKAGSKRFGGSGHADARKSGGGVSHVVLHIIPLEEIKILHKFRSRTRL